MKKKNKQFHIAVGRDTLYKVEDQSLYLSKRLTFPEVPLFTQKAIREIRALKVKSFILNLDKLEDIDSSGVTALYYVKKTLGKSGTAIRFEGGNNQVLGKIDLFKPEKFEEPPDPQTPGIMESTGHHVHHFFANYVFGFILLAANVFYFAVGDLFRRKTSREGEFANQAVLIGVNSVIIVVFMSFVIGLVLALQSSTQLRNFGANIFIVDLTVVAMMSQMGPLITGILVAGRSGSSIAAEIATMKVTSELDALQTMGLNPVRFVVIPKLYAALFTMPFLIILASVAGIFGGGVAAYIYLDISPEVFINRMGGVMKNKDLITGFVKSQVYAAIIVLTGSFYGFRVVRGAEGVGKATTAAVVVAISMVIIADSILGLLFY